ncbi:MAG: cofactor-independent phosphoglycerate mutase [Deltaproteobacteria bacterium RIFCSPLOWO2_02_FULL_50_16]|nr:MAG: cofactor-independent phosphoglycerate mutase [Deltaproteobacteria bacterium RIFCSPLOWO2_02_FULL_50_16]
MKYVIVLGDGMTGRPVKALRGKTTLEVARHPHLDRLASLGHLGLVDIIPKGMLPGSDIGHLSVLGYAPQRYYSGRAPIEAASMGVSLGPRDVAFRCNFVTLAYEKKGRWAPSAGRWDPGAPEGRWVMKDYSAGHIQTREAKRLIDRLNKKLGSRSIRFYPGVSYRHLMVWKNGHLPQSTTPPHDITGQPIARHFPKGPHVDLLNKLMIKANETLKGNPTQANAIWLWGEGKAMTLDRFPVKGGIISAVDIVRGIGVLAGLEVIKVPRMTGFLDTNYKGKVDFALRSLKKNDFVFIHIEAPDEAGHMGDHKKKIKAIEDIDKKIMAPLLKGLESLKPYRLLVTSDHATPVCLKTHSSDPVVYVLYQSGDEGHKVRCFHEREAAKTGYFVSQGTQLISQLFAS